jgi:glucosamine kinase
MDNFYLFESGATKTALLYVKDGQKHERKLPGFNPNISNNLFEIALKESVGMVEGADVVFYGSGLGSDANKEVVHKLFESHDPASVTVLDDIIGAARAAFKNQAGIICIMGTGGVSRIL